MSWDITGIGVDLAETPYWQRDRDQGIPENLKLVVGAHNVPSVIWKNVTIA